MGALRLAANEVKFKNGRMSSASERDFCGCVSFGFDHIDSFLKRYLFDVKKLGRRRVGSVEVCSLCVGL